MATDSSCIPYNLFSGGLPGDAGIQAVLDGGQELQSYIANTTFILGTGEQRLFQAVVSGQSGISIPGAPGFISVALGFEDQGSENGLSTRLAESHR